MLPPEKLKVYEEAAKADEQRYQKELKVVLENVRQFNPLDEVSEQFISMVKDVGIEQGKRPPRYLKQNGHETKAEDQEPNGTEEGDEWE